MARVLITGSSDGLGLLAGQQLTRGGHEVVLHARNQARAGATRAALPSASAVVVGDVSTLAGMAEVAAAARAAGPFDAVIHNVALGYRERRLETEDGLTSVFAVNVLAPYYLTAALPVPRRPVRNVEIQEGLLAACAKLTGIELPSAAPADARA
jgi:NAD(P)-dependent dehydrogenase (short-subunit alcohol dehydrogenase family)